MSIPQDPVEIKVTLSGKIPDAVNTLRLGTGSPLQIWFLEDLTPGLAQPLPLLAAGIILRLRSKGGEDDSTVKLRPCRRSQLGDRFDSSVEEDGIRRGSDVGKGKWEHRIEGDWAGSRRVLAASSVLTQPAGSVGKVVTPPSAQVTAKDLTVVFDDRQRAFLDQCADLKVNPSGLVPLGPISATKWKGIKIGEFQVNAERWSVGKMDFLELSIRVDADAEAAQSAFEAALRRLGLTFESLQTSKTEQVLRHLAGVAGPR